MRGQGNSAGHSQGQIHANPHAVDPDVGFCTGGMTGAILVGELPPPVTMAPGQTATVSLGYANCTNVTWTHAKGFMLRSGLSSADISQWGFTCVSLPVVDCTPAGTPPCHEAVPPGHQVTFEFTVTAPMIAGNYNYTWAVVHHPAGGVAQKVGEPSPVHTMTVEKNTDENFVHICDVPYFMPQACLIPPPPGFPPCTVPTPDTRADINGNYPAAGAIQNCIDNLTPVCLVTPPPGYPPCTPPTLELPVGIYLIDKKVVIDHPMTLRTAGTAGSTDGCWSPYPTVTPCAVLQPTDDFLEREGFFRIAKIDYQVVSGVVIDHLILNGNRDSRLAVCPDDQPGCAASRCAFQDTANPELNSNNWCFNATAHNCYDCELRYFASVHALAGSGLQFSVGLTRGIDFVNIHDSVFRDNGDYGDGFSTNLWSDGLLLGASDGLQINNNFFVDNSDVDLVVGGGYGVAAGSISYNRFLHPRSKAHVAMFMGNWGPVSSGTSFDHGRFAPSGTVCDPDTPSRDCGDYRGITVSNNDIDCGVQGCNVGLEIGVGRLFFQKLCSSNDRSCCCDSPSGCNPGTTDQCTVPPATCQASPATCCYPMDVSCCPQSDPNCASGFPNLFGGTFSLNTVTGARQGIYVNGAGSATYPTAVFANTTGGSGGGIFATQNPYTCSVADTGYPNCNIPASVCDTTSQSQLTGSPFNIGTTGNVPGGNNIDPQTDPVTTNNLCVF